MFCYFTNKLYFFLKIRNLEKFLHYATESYTSTGNDPDSSVLIRYPYNISFIFEVNFMTWSDR